MFLVKDYSNLICVDFICHGVPSPKVFKQYIQEKESVFESTVTSISFRDKREGWKTCMALGFNNGEEYIADFKNKDRYLQLFLRDVSLRRSCYNCWSKGDARGSDITLADYWGVEKIHPDLFDNKGTSLVIINSAKGDDVFDKIKHGLLHVQTGLEGALENNPNFFDSAQKTKNRDKFFKNIDKKSLKKNSSRYVRRRISFKGFAYQLLKKFRIIKR